MRSSRFLRLLPRRAGMLGRRADRRRLEGGGGHRGMVQRAPQRVDGFRILIGRRIAQQVPGAQLERVSPEVVEQVAPLAADQLSAPIRGRDEGHGQALERGVVEPPVAGGVTRHVDLAHLRGGAKRVLETLEQGGDPAGEQMGLRWNGGDLGMGGDDALKPERSAAA